MVLLHEVSVASLDDAKPLFLHRLAYWAERGGRGGAPPAKHTAASWRAFERRLARGGKEAPGKARGVFESPRLLGLTRTLSPSLRLGLLQENAISTVRALA